VRERPESRQTRRLSFAGAARRFSSSRTKRRFAANGLQALEVFGGSPRRAVSLLLTDLVMPGGMSGEQLAARLRESEPLLRIIYMSGYSPSIAGRELSLGPGASFLQKPFSPEVLLETVRGTLDAILASQR
jgi:CheY-like chemotaxis protein